MKVLHLIGSLYGGGAEHLVLELCKQSLADPHVEMSVATLSPSGNIAWKFKEAGAIVLSPVGKKPLSGAPGKWAGALFSIRALITQSPPVIHAHLFHACLAACLVKCIRPRSRIIFSLHNQHQPGALKRALLFLTRPLREKDVIFPGTAPSWYQKKRSVAIANGIRFDQFEAIGAEKPPIFTCLFVGRLDEQKNPLWLVEIARSLRPGAPFLIRVAGEGPLKEPLERSVRAHHLSGSFEILGYRNDIPALLREAHCLLIPSKWEGMPLAALEAGAAGVPVICTKAGSLPEVFDGPMAYLGSLEELGRLVSEVRDNYQTACARASLFKERVKNEYNITKIYGEHIKKLYDASGR